MFKLKLFLAYVLLKTLAEVPKALQNQFQSGFLIFLLSIFRISLLESHIFTRFKCLQSLQMFCMLSSHLVVLPRKFSGTLQNRWFKIFWILLFEFPFCGKWCRNVFFWRNLRFGLRTPKELLNTRFGGNTALLLFWAVFFF